MYKAACLQLMPENSTKWARFERLLEVALAIEPGDSRQSLTSKQLRQILTTTPITTPQVLSNEDPFDYPFVPSITFHGGNYRVIAGGAEGAQVQCQLVLDAVLRMQGEECAGFRAQVFEYAFVLLKLSELICQRVGLVRWTPPVQSKMSPLIIPADDALFRLERSITFSDYDLSALLGYNWYERIREFVVPGVLSITDHDSRSLTDDRIYLYPLAMTGDGNFIVTLPSGLSASITHRALAQALEQDLGEELVESLQKTHLSTLQRIFNRVHWARISGPENLETPRTFSEAFYCFDRDKIAHVCSVVDHLDDYDPRQPFGNADVSAVQDEIENRFSQVRSQLRKTLPSVSVLHIVALAPLGRSFVMGFTERANDSASTLLMANLDDLDLMTHLEDHDPLGLWKFAQAADRLRSTTRIFSFSTLDEYAIYRDHGRGYYLGDAARPNMITVSPGNGGAIRCRERSRLDEHAAALPKSGEIVSVIRWPTDDAPMIYRPENPRYNAFHLVEMSIPIWVIPVPVSAAEKTSSEDLAVAVAFWLWTCRDALRQALDNLAPTLKVVTVEVRMFEQVFDKEQSSDLEPVNDWMQCSIMAEGSVSVVLRQHASNRLAGPDNSAERVIAISLVEAIYSLANLDVTDTAASLRNNLQHGPMKMLHVLHTGDDRLLAVGHASPPRLLSYSDVEDVLDQVGKVMLEVLEIPVGPVEHAKRTEVLNTIVQRLFAELLDTLAEMDPEGLLELLASELDAIIHAEAMNTFQLPSQAACFGDRSSAVVKTSQMATTLISTAVANRFIIECVTAIRPSGKRLISVAIYDRLVALANQIVEFGFLSDAIRYGISSTKMSVLPSERLGFDRVEPYQTALKSYQQLIGKRRLGSAQQTYASHWARPTSDNSSNDLMELNEAYRAEFGVTAQELALLSSELIKIAHSAPRQIAIRALSKLVSEVSVSLSWPKDKTANTLRLFTLDELENFSPNGVPADSYPWRYSRNRSAIRRPLLIREATGGEIEVVWGPRATLRAGRYLIEQITSGRLKARSKQMQEFIATTRRHASVEFNEEVADHFRKADYDDVRKNVTQIGRIRLQRANLQEIGDIDVLVIDRSKKVLMAIEVKDFEFARTPAELSNEVAKLLWGEGSAAERHGERIKFLKQKLPEVLHELAVADPPSDWQVQGAIVTSGDLVTSQFLEAKELASGINIISINQLRARKHENLIKRNVTTSGSKKTKRSRRNQRNRRPRKR